MKKILTRVYVVALFSFLYLPIAVMLSYSFNESKSRTQFTGFTLNWYRQLFNNEMVLSALRVSLALAFSSAIVATLIGTMAAVGINRMGKRTRGLVFNVSYVPIVNPEIITGVSMMLLFVAFKNGLAALDPGSTGLLGAISRGFMGIPSLLVAHVTFNLPYVLFNVSPKLRQMDIRLYEAALDLGCNERQAFFKVVLPEIMPAILSSFLICLTYSIDDFTISYFTAGTTQTLPISIYAMTRRRVSPEINALSAIMFIAILAIILVSNYFEGGGQRKRRKARKARKEKQFS